MNQEQQISHSPEKIGVQVGKFAVVGAINTLIDIIILNTLVFLGFTAIIVFFEQKFLIANIISVAAAMVNSFILNKQWTFKSTDKKNIYLEIVKFFIITIIGMFIVHQLIFNMLYFNLPFISSMMISMIHFLKLNGIFSDEFVILNFSKIIAIFGSLVWNFIGYKFIVFNKK